MLSRCLSEVIIIIMFIIIIKGVAKGGAGWKFPLMKFNLSEGVGAV